MAVTKTSFVPVLVVLAITYNQGAARPTACATKYGSSSTEESQWDCNTYKIPTVVKNGLVITITGEMEWYAEDKALIVALSQSGKESCQFKFGFINKSIAVKPMPSGREDRQSYEFTVGPEPIEPESKEAETKKPPPKAPSFEFVITARNDDTLMMRLYTEEYGPSDHVYCTVDNMKDINQIDIKDGVAHVNSLLFKF